MKLKCCTDCQRTLPEHQFRSFGEHSPNSFVCGQCDFYNDPATENEWWVTSGVLATVWLNRALSGVLNGAN